MTILPPRSPFDTASGVYGSGPGVEEIAVWNLDGLASGEGLVSAMIASERGPEWAMTRQANQSPVAVSPLVVTANDLPVVTAAPPPPSPSGIPPWLVLLSALIPVTLLLGYVAKKARE